MKWITGHKGLVVLLLVALTVRLIYMFVMVGEVGGDKLLSLAPDTVAYSNIAHGMIDDGPNDEDALMMFGLGYAFFLGLSFLIFGASPYPILIVQVVLSSLGCLLIYILGKELTESKSVGLIAGYLAALSFTSVSLANFILSDSLFFFLFLLGNVFFLLGMRHNRYWWYLGAGVSIGAAILMRSIGQFWPAAMLLFIFVLPCHNRGHWRLADRLILFKKAYLAPMIALIIMGGWVTRNYIRYSVPFFTFAGAGGPANVAVAAINRMEGKEALQINAEWAEDFKRVHGSDMMTRVDMYRAYKDGSRKTFFRYPWVMMDECRKLIWENIGAMNELYYSQIPLHKYQIAAVMSRYHDYYFHYAGLWLSIVSGLVMLWRRQWRPLLFLGVVFVYFALMIGFTHWQGSRLFYPGQIAWAVAIGFLLGTSASYLIECMRRAPVVMPNPYNDMKT